MIRVGLVTTSWMAHRCGVAEYSRMLIDALGTVAPEVQVTPIFGPYEFANLYPRVMDGRFDVIHFNYDSGFLGIFAPGIATRFKEAGAKIVLTLCDHHPRNNRAIFPFTAEFDRVVVHMETNEGFDFIPIGTPILKDSPWSSASTTIGTCGFPLPQKRMDLVAQAAAILVKETPRITGCTMVCPESQHINTHQMGQVMKTHFPQVNYITSWLPHEEVMRIMAQNLVNVFPMNDGKSGISSSIRMGVGTGSHIVLSRSWMFSDWRDDERYSGEIEWVDGDACENTPRTVADAVLRVIENGKRPRRILEDGSWEKSAEHYADIYRTLAAKAVTA